ncbi:hypothetical protein H3C70_05335 [Patescibacteria group bacterium]|nr:hypothetical protein [Patescibacteria group bacterium]
MIVFFSTLLAQQTNLGGFEPPGGQTTFVPDDLSSTEGVLSTGQNLISFIITFLTIFAGLMFLYQFVRGALAWISAGGDQKKLSDARDMITQGVIGLVIIIAAYAIIGLISTVLGLDLLNPGEQLRQLVPTTGGGVTI